MQLQIELWNRLFEQNLYTFLQPNDIVNLL